MPAKSILVLNGHPGGSSLSHGFAETYAEAARAAGHRVRTHHVADMEFDIDFGDGDYSNHKPLEPALRAFMEDLEWSDHVVVAAPLWWGGLPAKLKGLFDRAFLPGHAFDTRNTTAIGLPKPLLTGRTARVIMTADTPRWLERFAYGRAIQKQLNRQILGFVGIKPTRHTWFAPASHATAAAVTGWMKEVADLGRAAA